MTLAHTLLEEAITTEGSGSPSLVIENQTFFRTLLQDISDQIAGMNGSSVLSQGTRILPFPSYAELIDSYLGFSLNRRPLLTKITAELEREAIASEHYAETMALLSAWERHLANLSFSFPCSLLCTKLNAESVWKAIGIEIEEDYEDPLEKILDYMALVREFDRDKLFVFVNLRSYFPDEKTELFLENVRDHGFQILLIDSQEHQRLPLERRVTIDCDLCEF